MTFRPQLFDVRWGILNIQVCPHCRLVRLETEVPVRDIVSVEPGQSDNSLLYQHVRGVGKRFEAALETMFFDDKTTPYPGLTRTYGVF